MRITDCQIFLVEISQTEPLAPYRSHLRISDWTTKAIVRLETDNGLIGWGEHNQNFLPNIDISQQSVEAQDFIIGWEPYDLEKYHRENPFESRLRCGIEMAMWDLIGKDNALPLYKLLGGKVRERIELAACMGIQSYERAGDMARWYVEQGYTTLKTKAGADAEEDFEMVRGVRDAVGDQLKLRIDPNRAYSNEEAADLAIRLEPFELEYFEQPIMAEPLSDAKWLRDQTTTPIALNESVEGPDSVMAILEADAAEFILPDTHTAGGILPCVKIGHLAEAANIPTIMHCGHDLGLKTAAMLHICAAMPAYSMPNDCTYYGLSDDILTAMIAIDRGTMTVPELPGLGVIVDDEKVMKYQTSNPS
ncbi:MAG: mandelate racemase/muconate lactonizing enzyme family protein [Planctomycetaceae bacterium]